MATDSGIVTPPGFNFDPLSSNQKDEWESWIETLELYFLASNITDNARKKALLLYLGGSELRKIYNTLEDEGTTYEKALKELDKYFEVKVNYTFQRNIFRNLNQNQGESSRAYITRLKTQAIKCDFNNYSAESAVVDQYITTISSSALRRRLLSEKDLNLDKLMEIVLTQEVSSAQACAMESKIVSEETVNKIGFTKKKYSASSSNFKKQNYNSSSSNFSKTKFPQNTNRPFVKSCYGCGQKDHFHGSEECPAKGKKCSFCNLPNHFETQCLIKKRNESGEENRYNQKSKKNINVLMNESNESSEEEYLFSLNNKSDITIKIDNCSVQVLRDTGATINLIDKNTFNKLKQKINLILHPTKTKIFTYNAKTPLKLDGVFYSNASYKNNHYIAKFFVSSEPNGGCIIGRNTAIQLGLLRLTEEINNVTSECNDSNIETIINRHKNIFTGLGKLKNTKVKFEIDENITPVAQQVRRIPFHLRQKVENKIEELLNLDIIEKVKGATPWVSPIVAVPKGEDIRLTIDMRKPNMAIKPFKYPIPTLEELLSKFNGCNFFSKVDLNNGYHQLELDEGSRHITAFITHTGIYQYKRLVQGASPAFQIYQYEINKLFLPEPLIENICDDILIAGKTKEEHDKNVESCLRILQENNLTVNSRKCIWAATELQFYGHTISNKGVKPSLGKVKAVKNFTRPQNSKEVASFLGLVNYLGSFIKDLATLTAPLRELLRKEVKFRWGELEEETFNKLKNLVSSKTCIAHFNEKLETILITDASKCGLGAILAQRQLDGSVRPVLFASRSLTRTEVKYSQTEKEALSVVWGCERMHLYLYGKPFKIYSDHEPLKCLYSPTGRPSPRILRWGLRLQSYQFQIEHIPGRINPADFLSIKPESINNENDEEVEQYINFIIAHSTPKAITLSDIIHFSSKDEIIQKVIKFLEEDEWEKGSPEIEQFFKIRHELTYKSGILLKSDRIVVPNSLREKILKISHESHLGMVKTKLLLREKVYWPNMNKQIEEMISKCIPCQCMGKTNIAPMQHNNLPIGDPWKVVHIDIAGPYPSGEYVLGIIDSTSRWPDLFITKNTSSKSIIKFLLQSFSTHGFPEEIKTDNGKNLISIDIQEFCSMYGIKHKKSTPYHPEGNSEIERFYRSLGKFIKTITAEGKIWQQEIYNFLLIYRNTPHLTTGVTPAKLLMNRSLRDKIPTITINCNDNLLEKAKKEDARRKTLNKQYFDKKNKVKINEIEAGDWVIMRQNTNKIKTKFENKPLKVIKVKGNSIIVEKEGKEVMRNYKEFRKLNYSENNEFEQEHENCDYDQNQYQTQEEKNLSENDEIKSQDNYDNENGNQRNHENESHEEENDDENERNDQNELQEETSDDENENDIRNTQQPPIALQNNQVLPKRNQKIMYKTKENDEWIEATVLQQQPKRTGNYASWVNIHNNDDSDSFCINWDFIESWRVVD